MKDAEPGMYLKSLLSDCFVQFRQKKDSSSFQEGYFQNAVDRMKDNNCLSEFIHSSALNELMFSSLLTGEMVEYLLLSSGSKEDVEHVLSNPELVCLLLESLKIDKKLSDHLKEVLTSEKYYYSDIDLLDYLDDLHKNNEEVQRYLVFLKSLRNYTTDESATLRNLCLKNPSNIEVVNSVALSNLENAYPFEEVHKICSERAQKRKISLNF